MHSVKDALLPSKKVVFICFNQNPLKLIRNGFYFILKALFLLKLFKLLLRLFLSCIKTAW